MATASGRTSGHSDASVADEQSLVRQRQCREPGKPTWRCLNQLSLSSAWLSPLNRGSLNSAHIRGTDVPVEEPSTASIPEVADTSHAKQKPPEGGFSFWVRKLSGKMIQPVLRRLRSNSDLVDCARPIFRRNLSSSSS